MASAQFQGLPRSPGDTAVRFVIDHLDRHDTRGVLNRFDPRALPTSPALIDSLLLRLDTGFAIGQVHEIRLINRTYFRAFNTGEIDEQLAYHVLGQSRNLLVFAATHTDSTSTSITELRWQLAPADLRRMNPFTLSGKSWLHYVFLTVAVLVPLLCLATALVSARSTLRLKWLWVAFSLVGLAKVSILWVDAQASHAAVRFVPFSIQLLGAGVLKYPLYAPWVISVSLPLGALLFWIVVWRRRSVHLPPGAHGAA
jgi:hypothetical protein